MDFLTPLGLIVALLAIGLGQHFEGGNLTVLLNPSALLIVLGGSIGAAMIQSRATTFREAIVLCSWIIKPPSFPMQESISRFTQWSRIIRKSGLMTLEKHVQNLDSFLAIGIDSLLQGMDAIQIRQILEIESEKRIQKRFAAANVYACIGGYSPTIGIIGAVLGLIEVMAHLDDPSHIGAGIAVAFVATVYGVALANLFFIPIANKLKAHVEREENYYELIIDGVTGLALNESPKLIEYKLKSHVNAQI